MRTIKNNGLLSLLNDYVIDAPTPSNISYLWNFGSLLGLCLIIQIVTGVTLAMHYNPSVLEAFNSIEHIMRDVNNGWLIRYLHANTASAFFFLVYLHIGRGLYYGSYKAPRAITWTVGTIILVLMIITGFLGYVLPYGQMSLWGATVITNLMSAIPWIGQDIVEFLWGGFSVNNATLNRFFALHFVLPFVLAALVLVHLIALHDTAAANNPIGILSNYDKIPFAPYYVFKDLITVFLFILGLSLFVFFMPNALGDSENYVVANPMQTPPAIVPEWYLLPYYAILRSIPNKLFGVIAMLASLLILLTLPFSDLSRSRGIQFRPFSKIAFYVFVANFFILMQLGAKHVESPFIEFGQISTIIYFSYFLVAIPAITLLENSLIELTDDKEFTVDKSSFKNKSLGISSLVFSLLVIYYSNNFNNILLDAPTPWGLYFQDSATPQMEALEELHDNILFYLAVILFAVGWILISVMRNYTNKNSPVSLKHVRHGTLIELIWTITPAIILILIAFPSFKLLYLMDEITDPAMVVVAEGHQWYWSYQYPDFLTSDEETVEFDSYLVPESDLEEGTLRMLEVDNRVIIPELTHIRFIVTAADVIHSFGCPALGIKCDAYPGRLNQISILANREGTFYGQCSEICGILHSSMPIVIQSVSIEKFLSWLQDQ
jgi:ubiquinol-cytochrome c reductase cytochrome b subunit